MSKQWGHGNHAGKIEALRDAATSIKHLQDREVYAMALVNKLMLTHPDRNLVDDVHKAINNSKMLSGYFYSGMWHGMGAGLFVETCPPMTKKQAQESLFAEAKKHGWRG